MTRGSRAWFVVDPPDGRIPPLVPSAKARSAQGPRGSFGNGPFNGPQDFSLWERCITRGLPGSMVPGVYGNSYQIVQSPGFVAIRYEMVHDTRVIPLDARAPVPGALRFDFGVPRGHWEGDTLVVETTNFLQRSAFRNADAGSLRLVERFRRTGRGLGRMVGDRGRSEHVDTAVDVRDALDAERRRGHRGLRLPRRQPGHLQHPERGTGRRARTRAAPRPSR